MTRGTLALLLLLTLCGCTLTLVHIEKHEAPKATPTPESPDGCEGQ